MRVRAFNPPFDEDAELLRALEKFRRFGGCGDLYSGVVDHVAFPPASIEKEHQFVSLFAERNAGTFKAESMMPWNSSYAVSRAGRCHSRHL